MAAVDVHALLRQGLASEGRERRAREAPVQEPSARADAAPQGRGGEGFLEFESELKPYQYAVKHLTSSNVYDVLPKFEGANLHLDKLRRLGEVTHRESARVRIKFRVDLNSYKRLDMFTKKLQSSWKGRLVELFCKVLDVENDKKFRQRGQNAPLEALFAQRSQKWDKRLAGSKGKALQEVDHCFEGLQLQAAKEAAELHSLEVAFDEQQDGGPSQAPRSGKRRRRGDLRESPVVGARAPSQRPAPSARPAPSSAVGAQPPSAAGGPSQVSWI